MGTVVANPVASVRKPLAVSLPVTHWSLHKLDVGGDNDAQDMATMNCLD